MNKETGILTGTLPWTRSCFVCGEDNPRGFHLRSRIEGDTVYLTYTTGSSDVGYRHLVHGGILMTLLDEVMTWACIIAEGGVCVAAEMTTRLRKPVSENQAIRVEGRVVSQKKRLLVTEGRILDETGGELLVAAGKYMPAPREEHDLCVEDFVLSDESLDPAALLKAPPGQQGGAVHGG